MSARDTILLALTRYYESNADPRGTASQVLTGYDNARREDLLSQRADVRDRMLADAHAAGRAEVLAGEGLLLKADVVAWLVEKAREIPRGNKIGRAQGDVLAVMASKVARGAVRPDNLRMLPNPGFFEAGRAYRSSQHGDLQFRCLAIEPQPDTGEVRAVGWRHNGRSGKWTLTDLGADDWACCGWTEVTEGGAG
ncbi:hypothetical protein [Streptomyces aureus]